MYLVYVYLGFLKLFVWFVINLSVVFIKIKYYDIVRLCVVRLKSW